MRYNICFLSFLNRQGYLPKAWGVGGHFFLLVAYL